MSEKKKMDWFNQKVGGFGLAIVILTVYVGYKFSLIGTITPAFAWYVIWFTGIIFSALSTDLFVNNKLWVENAMENITRIDLSTDQRVAVIKQQLEIAVDRYLTVFLMVNGIDSAIKKAWINVKKIYKGCITIKELLIIVVYALWDLVIRNGLPNLENPLDICVLFFGLMVLKIVDADSGFASLVAEMYKEIDDSTNQDVILTSWANYIKQLANLYDLTYVNDQSVEEQFENALKLVRDLIPKLDSDAIKTIKEKVKET